MNNDLLLYVIIGFIIGIGMCSVGRGPEIVRVTDTKVVTEPCPKQSAETPCTPSYSVHSACAECCEKEYWELGRTPEGSFTIEPVLCAEHCLRVAKALCLFSDGVEAKCKTIADTY